MRDLAKALVDIKGSIAFGPSALTGDSRIRSPAQAPKLERPYTLIVAQHLDPATEQAVAGLVDSILGPGRQAIARASN